MDYFKYCYLLAFHFLIHWLMTNTHKRLLPKQYQLKMGKTVNKHSYTTFSVLSAKKTWLQQDITNRAHGSITLPPKKKKKQTLSQFFKTKNSNLFY